MEIKDQAYALQPDTILVSPQSTYIIRRILGVGGFGITYLADMKVGNIVVQDAVCIKEFFPRSLCERDGQTHAMSYSIPTKDQVERTRRDFIGEARRLESLAGKSSGIVTVNEVFEANNTAYYVMEYLRGQTLSDFVKASGAMSWQQTKAVFEKMIEAVAFLHQNHVTHLDIKPANIMLVPKGDDTQPVLIDFGLSKHYNEDGSATSTINSQGFSDGYAPIEQYGGITRFSPSADVYAIGATMVFCLTGHRPEASTADPDFADVLTSLVPTADRTVLLKALSYRSKDRYGDAGAFYQALYNGYDSTQILSATNVVPTPPAMPTPPPMPAQEDVQKTVLMEQGTEETGKPQRPTLVNDSTDASDVVNEYDKKLQKKSKHTGTTIILVILVIGVIFALLYAGGIGYGNERAATDSVDSSYYYYDEAPEAAEVEEVAPVDTPAVEAAPDGYYYEEAVPEAESDYYDEYPAEAAY